MSVSLGSNGREAFPVRVRAVAVPVAAAQGDTKRGTEFSKPSFLEVLSERSSVFEFSLPSCLDVPSNCSKVY